MTDMVVSVRIKADGSGLAGQLKQGKAGLDDLATGAKGAAAAARDASAATEGLAASQRSAAAAGQRLDQSQRRVASSVGAQRAAFQQLGFQAQDVAVQYQAGTAAGIIFAQQGGQIIQALAGIGSGANAANSRLAAFGTFMAGPWGATIGVAVTVAGVLATKLFDAAEASKAAELGANGLSQAQSVLGEIFDLTSGKIKAQNELLILNARLTAINLRAEALAERTSSRRAFDQAGSPSTSNRALAAGQGFVTNGLGGALTGAFGGDRVAQRNAANLRNLVGNVRSGQLPIETALRLSETQSFEGLKLSRQEFQKALIDSVSSTAKERTAELIDQSLADGVLATELRREGRMKKPGRDRTAERAAKEAERLADFGDRAGDTIARLRDQFDNLGSGVARANEATRDLDNLIEDLEKRKPPNYQALVEQAKALKPLIQDSLVRPFTDILDSQARQIELNRAVADGREAEADALQLTYQLMDRLGVESEEQLATELAKRGVRADEVRQLYENLGVMRQQTREIDVQREKQQAYLDLIGDARASIEQMLGSLRTQGPAAIGDFFKNLLGSFDQLFARQLTEELFGDIFRDLEDQVTGANKVGRAGDKIARDMESAGTSVARFADVVDTAAAKIANAGSTAEAGAGVDGQDIVVMGRSPLSPFRQGYEEITKGLGRQLKNTFTDIFGDRGLFSATTQKVLGKAFGGAQVGATFGTAIGKTLGLKTSSLGGAIGGALGSAVAGPIGSVVGGFLGSTLGGLFKSSKKASATITSVDSAATVTGNSSARKQASSALATSVQDGLRQIASQLGGDVGSFNVSIGMRNDDYRVDTTGSGRTKGPTKSESRNEQLGLFNFGDDANAAIAFAIADALKDGAVTGLSEAVKKALTSSTDLNKALSEALKVQEVEILAGGIGAELRKQFADFEREAKERVRIAKQYGFDVVAIEKKNAEDRAKIVDEITRQRIGSLQDLLADLQYGSLAEGTLADQRQALLVEIAKAKTDAEAGVDGAADKLADLSRRLVELSREAFGTAGAEYGADRATAIGNAEAIIKAENDRIRAAQGATGETNAKLDQANRIAATNADTLTQIRQGIDQLVRVNGGLISGGNYGGPEFVRIADLTRQASL